MPICRGCGAPGGLWGSSGSAVGGAWLRAGVALVPRTRTGASEVLGHRLCRITAWQPCPSSLWSACSGVHFLCLCGRGPLPWAMSGALQLGGPGSATSPQGVSPTVVPGVLTGPGSWQVCSVVFWTEAFAVKCSVPHGPTFPSA